MRIDAEICVLGSGFGGTLTALVLDRIGLDVVVFERDKHPRFTIGESSTPSGNMILGDLADRYDLPGLRPLTAYGTWQEAYPEVVAGRKRGFSYFHHSSGSGFAPEPGHASELLVAASSDPYYSDTQWLRADVDSFLVDRVRAAGIPLLEQTEVENIERDGQWRVQAQRNDETVHCEADFVVDATGQSGLLHSHGWTGADASLNTRSRALFGHFQGLPRWQDIVSQRGGLVEDYPFPCDHATIHHVLEHGWMWELRFNDGRVSAGLVLDQRYHAFNQDMSPEEEWEHHLRRYPTLEERFSNTEFADPPGGIVRTGRLQHLANQAAGEGWALLPFTAGFVDPLHSTGISHTLRGIEKLGRIFEAHGAQPPESELEAYSLSVRRELHFVDDLVGACYEALPSFRGWTASTLLYFAAMTTYERKLADGNDETDRSDFLCADNSSLRQIAREARNHVAAWPNSGPTTDQVEKYEEFVEASIRPFNEVGLFNPSVPGMYPHTAPPTQHRAEDA